MLGWGNEKSRIEAKDYFGKEKKLIDHGEEGEFKDSQICADPQFREWLGDGRMVAGYLHSL